MPFNLQKFFTDIFNPQKGEVLTIMHDMPHGEISDNQAWIERRRMAKEWHDKLVNAAYVWDIKVNDLVSYEATGSANADLPKKGRMSGREVDLEKLIKASSIILILSEFSATAPLKSIAKKSGKIRGATMPDAAKFMEQTSLSADYKVIQQRCRQMAPMFEQAIGAEAVFSTGHKCYFDISKNNPVHRSDAFLHPEVAGTMAAICNLPTGEVYIVPNEDKDSKTEGELPEKFGDEVVVYVVKHNQIVDVKGKGPRAKEMKQKFQNDPAWRNIAEFAVGCNDKARVCGVTVEDEKAGFHWAYGRSDHFGGLVGVKDFVSPNNVIHQDVVYAKECPIICTRLDMIYPDDTRKTLIKDGEILI
ncbi:MAG: hypothetical protein ABH859_01165 [Pseudomonadota bacterium]